MPIYFIGVTLDVLGKFLIILVTLRIHIKHFRVHKVKPKDVRLDIAMTVLGLVLILAGYLMKLPQDIQILY